MSEYTLVQRSSHRILTELIDGSKDSQYSWVLNPGSDGLLGVLRRLSASEASANWISGKPSIAAQTNHIRFSLELLNRRSKEEHLFNDEAWENSWKLQSVTNKEWRNLLDQLDKEAHEWMNAVLVSKRERDEDSVTEILTSVSHIAYHFGAIRQLLSIAFESSH